ncbi:hypothetical protein [Rathayibacter sp. AY2B9]|uniref:hypothetical protein n=1 Tax=Rathayibacter sp. AY2B9 TaxID=2080572 RepID=UPI0011B0D769|nr:hypothetical protein [Rathayibacter sp. AY2B9]
MNEPFAAIASTAVQLAAHEKSTTRKSGARSLTSFLEAEIGAVSAFFPGKGLGDDTLVHLSADSQERWERALVAARTGTNRGDEPEAPAPPVGVQALRQRQVRLSDEQKAKLAAEHAPDPRRERHTQVQRTRTQQKDAARNGRLEPADGSVATRR